MSKWQPIETAPKDGTWILLYDEQDVIEVGWWESFDCPGGGAMIGWCVDRVTHPTHWMPLPEPPETDDE